MCNISEKDIEPQIHPIFIPYVDPTCVSHMGPILFRCCLGCNVKVLGEHTDSVQVKLKV